MYRLLSHFLNSETPGFGGKEGEFSKIISRSIASGDSSNESSFIFNAHIGTHVDAPFHFDDAGKKISDYPPAHWISTNPYFLQLDNCKPDELIEIAEYEERIPKECDALFLRTGFECHRGSEIYWKNNPGITANSGIWLRRNRSKIRFLGLDLISLTAYQKRSEGREAHKCFLGKDVSGEPIMIIEDMHLSEINEQMKAVFICPLMVEGGDGAPVTVIAVM